MPLYSCTWNLEHIIEFLNFKSYWNLNWDSIDFNRGGLRHQPSYLSIYNFSVLSLLRIREYFVVFIIWILNSSCIVVSFRSAVLKIDLKVNFEYFYWHIWENYWIYRSLLLLPIVFVTRRWEQFQIKLTSANILLSFLIAVSLISLLDLLHSLPPPRQSQVVIITVSVFVILEILVVVPLGSSFFFFIYLFFILLRYNIV